MPNTEPNFLPPLFDDWQDWRRVYTTYAGEFNASSRLYPDEALLKMRLVRLGFFGVNLDREIEFIKENV